MLHNHRPRLIALFVLAGALAIPALSRAQTAHEVTYQGVTLQPGDVINFHAFLNRNILPGTYGHTSMYLGIDTQNGQRTFLDFTTAKASDLFERALGTPKPFLGRLMDERQFLTVNSGAHDTFDVFRLKDTSKIKQPILMQEARRRSDPKISWGTSLEVCSTTVADVLSVVSDVRIDVITPGGFASSPLFRKHPQQQTPINVRAAMADVRPLPPANARRSAQLSTLVPRMVTAQRQARRTALTASEYVALSEQRRARLQYAQWDYLRTLVGFACSAPGALDTLNDAGQVAGVTLEYEALQVYVAGDSKSLSRCDAEIFAKLLASGGAAPIESLVDWGRTYRSQHGAQVALKKLVEKMKAFASEFGQALASTGQGDGSSAVSGNSGSTSNSSSGSGSSSPGTEPRSTPSRPEPPDLPKLRGVNASGWPK